MTAVDDSWSEEEVTTPPDAGENANADSVAPKTVITSASTSANEDNGEDEAWCEVSHHKKKKAGAKGGDPGTPMSSPVLEGGKGTTRNIEGLKDGRGGYNSPMGGKKGAKGYGKSGHTEPRVVPARFERDDQKSTSKDDPGSKGSPQMEGQPLPPWRKKAAGTPPAVPAKGGPGESPPNGGWSPQKSGGYGTRASPKKSPALASPTSGPLSAEQDPDLDHALPPIAVSFKALHKDKPDKESSPTKARHDITYLSPATAPTAAPDGENPEVNKRRVRDDVHDEVNRILEICEVLERNDFDSNSRQFLHAIHNLGGREAVHAALNSVEMCASRKTRDSVRNWSGYVATILQKYFKEIGGGKNQKEKKKEDKGEEKGAEKGEDKDPKELRKTEGPQAALAGSLTSPTLHFGPTRPRAKA